jgi:hypothetical protein
VLVRIQLTVGSKVCPTKLGEISTILMGWVVVCGFAQSLQENTWIVPCSGDSQFLSNLFQHIV